jgi:hypothetical protein
VEKENQKLTPWPDEGSKDQVEFPPGPLRMGARKRLALQNHNGKNVCSAPYTEAFWGTSGGRVGINF